MIRAAGPMSAPRGPPQHVESTQTQLQVGGRRKPATPQKFPINLVRARACELMRRQKYELSSFSCFRRLRRRTSACAPPLQPNRHCGPVNASAGDKDGQRLHLCAPVAQRDQNSVPFLRRSSPARGRHFVDATIAFCSFAPARSQERFLVLGKPARRRRRARCGESWREF